MVSHSCSGPQNQGPRKGVSHTLPGLYTHGAAERRSHTPARGYHIQGPPRGGPTHLPGTNIHRGPPRGGLTHLPGATINRGPPRGGLTHLPGLLYRTIDLYMHTYTYTHRRATTTMATQNKGGGNRTSDPHPSTRTSGTTRSTERPQQHGHHPH